MPKAAEATLLIWPGTYFSEALVLFEIISASLPSRAPDRGRAIVKSPVMTSLSSFSTVWYLLFPFCSFKFGEYRREIQYVIVFQNIFRTKNLIASNVPEYQVLSFHNFERFTMTRVIFHVYSHKNTVYSFLSEKYLYCSRNLPNFFSQTCPSNKFSPLHWLQKSRVTTSNPLACMLINIAGKTEATFLSPMYGFKFILYLNFHN